METSETTKAAPTESPPAAQPTPTYTDCGSCGAPLDEQQRYCVKCGAHNRQAPDPAARYFSEASSRSRMNTAAAASGARPTRRQRSSGLALAVMLALIPVAVAIGVSVGRSSNNDDAKLIQALSKRQAQTAGTAAAETTAAANAKTAAKAKKHKSSAKRAGHSSSGGKNAHKPGNITAVPTAAQKKQGAAIVKKLQHTTGTKFLDQLPPEVTIP